MSSNTHAELLRVQSIDNFALHSAIPGHESLIRAARADGKSTAGDVALAILRAERERPLPTHSLQAAYPSLPDSPARSVGRQPHARKWVDHAVVEQSANAEWLASAAVREEFRGDQAAFVAFKKAEASGLAKAWEAP